MAKRSKSNKGRRDIPSITNVKLSFLLDDNPLTDFEDRRHFNPERVPVAREFLRPSRIVVRPRVFKPRVYKSRRIVHLPLGFQAPRNTLICVRRKVRKEILFAGGFGGKRRKKFRKPRRNFYSNIRC